ncbi:Hypothetical predicted protein [Pelobates cultripes]|uniref:Uncharacterized protein n=1 Tax=Pelobates cultripes TaxID=61616 RepID=A0AAD1RGL3_PELCU|nr:Hypothetical predicted protein [Pelobates cultripes]
MRGWGFGRSSSTEVLQMQNLLPPLGPSGVIAVHHGAFTSMGIPVQALLDGHRQVEATTPRSLKMAAVYNTTNPTGNTASHTRDANDCANGGKG